MELTRAQCSSSNFAAGRPAGMQPEAIVLHRTGGTAEEIRARFIDSSAAMSAHYLVEKDGRLVQFVAEQDTAFHAGLAINPVWSLLKPNVNPNFYTIGVEFEGAPGDAIPDEQSDSCAALLAAIAARYGFPLDSDHVVFHSQIRASRNCPGEPFDRDALLQKALVAATAPAVVALDAEVEILKDTNVREGVPSSSARIVSVMPKGTKTRVNGFSPNGEPVRGNSAWYHTTDGNFFWAGNSSQPQPAVPADDTAGVPPPQPPPVAAEVGAPAAALFQGCPVGIASIDRFFVTANCPPLELASADAATVGVVQDLLTAQGCSKLPSILAPNYGVATIATLDALRAFQADIGVPSGGDLTQAALRQLVAVPAKDPRASQAYLSLVLGIAFTGMERVLAITAQMEGAGKFAALNLNTDGAGLSFGLIQWSQSTGRLFEIVSAFRQADADVFTRVFGDGDSSVGDRLLAHLKLPSGGVIPGSGVTSDPQVNLIADPWVQRFQQAALVTKYQQVQVATARKAFENSLSLLRQYDTAGLVRSERAVAFMLDVANQFGNGRVQRPAPGAPDKGLAGLYRRVSRNGMTEADLLEGIANATVAAMPQKFQAGVRARRTLFLTTKLFSDTAAFQDSPASGAAQSV